MGLGARVVERTGKVPRVSYRWDPETDILTGALQGAEKLQDPGGLTGSVELEGNDGSFILLDVQSGRIRGVEVVVWPDVRTTRGLQPPSLFTEGDVQLPNRRSQPNVAAVEVDTAIGIETNPAESVFRIRVGPSRRVQTVRVAEGLLVELDEQSDLAGLWLTGVPPFPADDGAG